MKEAIELSEYLESQEIKNSFENIFSALKYLGTSEKRDVVQYLNTKTESIQKSIDDIVLKGDDEEYSGMLVSLWLENRLEWNRYNCQMQYQAMNHGKSDQLLMAKGSCLSLIIDIIEQRLTAQDLYWVVKIAVDPIEAVSYRMQQNSKLVQKTSSYGKISNNIINNQIEMLDYISKSKASNKVINKFKDHINSSVDKISNIGFLELRDLSDCIESILLNKMKAHALQFNVNHIDFSMPIGIPPEVIEGIQYILEDYLDLLLDQSIEKSISQRVGKSDFVNFRWSLELHNDCFYFCIEDDGLGCNDWKIKQDHYNNLGLFAEITNNPKKGSKLKLGLKFLNVIEVLLFEVHNQKGVEKFAIDSSKVIYNSMGNRRNDEFEVVTVKFFDQQDKDHKIIFEDFHKKRWLINCDKIIGLYLSRPSLRAVQEDYSFTSGGIEKGSDVYKIISTEKISKDDYE